jgi:hypothetical protein
MGEFKDSPDSGQPVFLFIPFPKNEKYFILQNLVLEQGSGLTSPGGWLFIS